MQGGEFSRLAQQPPAIIYQSRRNESDCLDSTTRMVLDVQLSAKARASLDAHFSHAWKRESSGKGDAGKKREVVLQEVVRESFVVDVLLYDFSLVTYYSASGEPEEEDVEDEISGSAGGCMTVVPPPSVEFTASKTTPGLLHLSILPRTLPISSTHSGRPFRLVISIQPHGQGASEIEVLATQPFHVLAKEPSRQSTLGPRPRGQAAKKRKRAVKVGEPGSVQGPGGLCIGVREGLLIAAAEAAVRAVAREEEAMHGHSEGSTAPSASVASLLYGDLNRHVSARFMAAGLMPELTSLVAEAHGAHLAYAGGSSGSKHHAMLPQPPPQQVRRDVGEDRDGQGGAWGEREMSSRAVDNSAPGQGHMQGPVARKTSFKRVRVDSQSGSLAVVANPGASADRKGVDEHDLRMELAQGQGQGVKTSTNGRQSGASIRRTSTSGTGPISLTRSFTSDPTSGPVPFGNGQNLSSSSESTGSGSGRTEDEVEPYQPSRGPSPSNHGPHGVYPDGNGAGQSGGGMTYPPAVQSGGGASWPQPQARSAHTFAQVHRSDDTTMQYTDMLHFRGEGAQVQPAGTGALPSHFDARRGQVWAEWPHQHAPYDNMGMQYWGPLGAAPSQAVSLFAQHVGPYLQLHGAPFMHERMHVAVRQYVGGSEEGADQQRSMNMQGRGFQLHSAYPTSVHVDSPAPTSVNPPFVHVAAQHHAQHAQMVQRRVKGVGFTKGVTEEEAEVIASAVDQLAMLGGVAQDGEVVQYVAA